MKLIDIHNFIVYLVYPILRGMI